MQIPKTPTVVVILTLTACGGPRVDVAAETEALEARSAAVVAAEAAMDIETAMTFWADDAVLQPPGAPRIEGKAAIEALYQEYFGSGLVKEFSGGASHIGMSDAGDLAYEVGFNRMVLNGPDGDLVDVGKYLAIWEKIDGEWYLTALSFNSDAPAPMPAGGE